MKLRSPLIPLMSIFCLSLSALGCEESSSEEGSDEESTLSRDVSSAGADDDAADADDADAAADDADADADASDDSAQALLALAEALGAEQEGESEELAALKDLASTLAASQEPDSGCSAGEYGANCEPCPAGLWCQASGAIVACAVGQYCPEGTTTPEVCAAGSYCATPASEPVECAAGDFCPAGSAEAIECAAGSWDDDSNSTTACVTKATCVAGESIAVEGDAKTDRSCAACEEGSLSNEENSASCTAFSTCANGVETEGSAVADVVCKPEAVSISSGYSHSCAVLETGAVNCWGNNNFSQLGNGSGGVNATTPVAVDGFDGIDKKAVSISLSYGHSCAVLETGAVNCWGYNVAGQLGNGSSGGENNSDTPVAVNGIDGSEKKAVSISLGEFHTCALLNTGAVNCWGYNDRGQLGNGSSDNSNFITTPAAVNGFDGSDKKAVSISLGQDHSCAVLNTGAVNCWGDGAFGQLGNGSSGGDTNSDTPVEVNGFDGIEKKAVSISLGQDHSCAVLNTGAVNCWGYNFYGQLGNGSSGGGTNSDTPVAVNGIDGIEKKAVSISLGEFHSCALLDTGAVNCWGSNIFGALGNGARGFDANSDTPVAVNGIDGIEKKAVSISLGEFHSCALLDTGAVNCWGDNSLGAGTTTSSSTPVAVIWP